MLIDIFITTKKRQKLLERSLASFESCTDRKSYRLTLVRDGYDEDTSNVIKMFHNIIDYDLCNMKNAGLGPSINMALSHIDSLKRWDIDKSILTAYLQDDVLYSPGWLEKISTKLIQLGPSLKLGFASGIECIEHPIKCNLGNGMILKDWIRATCMIARHDYWMSMWPISRIDPETGRERGRPHEGMGSSVDWWFVRNHENSVCRTGRTNLVFPGLLQHIGYKESTWLDRELPESSYDKERMLIACQK